MQSILHATGRQGRSFAANVTRDPLKRQSFSPKLLLPLGVRRGRQKSIEMSTEIKELSYSKEDLKKKTRKSVPFELGQEGTSALASVVISGKGTVSFVDA